MEHYLKGLYKNRFSGREIAANAALWKALCAGFFRRYVPRGASVLDIGAGYCGFINNIECAKKYAVDLNEEISKFASKEVEARVAASDNLSFLPDGSIDIVFMSNFLEHLDSKEGLLKTLAEVRRVLKAGGRVIIMGPNIRYAYREYWDFFDHRLPLSERSAAEALAASGFQIEKVIAKFLPYTTKSKLPKNPIFVRLYLMVPLLWRVLGRQMLVIAGRGDG